MPKKLKYTNLKPDEKEPDSPKVVAAKTRVAARIAELKAKIQK